MLFKSEQSIFSYFIFVFLPAVFGFIAIYAPDEENEGEGLWIPLTVFGLLFCFFVYTFFTTYYTIS